ncbi:Ig-like domain-containing protein [Nocardioides furvisabuli]|uniref:Ig-like domain-containing protein n=1 Tax=Nocardioides furvisabuli TaxID=375542 RepID=A0ABP5IR66_9ACTN|nr:Ig-like domain-containing protein [Nocardioides furvisabuli]
MRIGLPRGTRRRLTTARRPRSRKVASTLSLAVVASSLVVLAVRADGTPISDVDLNDGSVWVTIEDPAYQLLGRLNPQVRELDLAIQALSGDFDVHQRETSVLLDVKSGGRGVRQVDVAAGTALDPVPLSADTTVALGGDTIAMLDRETGEVWVRTTQTIQGFTADQTPADLEAGRDAALAVGQDGTAYVVNREKRTLTTVTIDASGLAAAAEPVAVDARLSTDLEVTVVGTTPVVLDREAEVLVVPELEPVPVELGDSTAAQVQQPGPQAAGVYVATRAGLLLADLGDGSVEQVRDGVDGPPAAPVVVDGYVHAAWADPAADGYVRLGGSEPAHAEKIPGLKPLANLVFRVNRSVVVLNDTVTGVSWLVQEDGLPRVDNWDDVDPSKKKEQTADPSPDELAKARRTEDNRPPVARDDRLGARPGQDSIIPVTRNDVDLDGDILTLTSLEDVKQLSGPEPQRMAIVGDGTQLQLHFGPNDGGKQARFSYVISDGRENGSDEATLEVSIVGTEQNTPPQLVEDNGVPRQQGMTVARGQRTSMYVLPDWTDAEGDSLVLQDARAKEGGTVTFRSDGVLEFVDDGGRAGNKTIEIVVSDGHPRGQRTGKVTVNVSPKNAVPPTLTPDRAVGVSGSDILIEPLANDFSRDGTELHLRDVVALGGMEITTDPTSGTFVARTSAPGTYYLDYSAYTNRGEAQSFVRLDVLPKSKVDLPPVAMSDDTLLPPSGSSLVDLLANDSDPEGGVLAVTSVRVGANTPVKASLLENRLLRVESTRDLTAPVSIDYTVSDGVNSAEGSVTVGQAPVKAGNRAPVAANDRITVRAGSVGSILVLANDFDPDGDDLQLFQQDLVAPEGLPVFVSGDTLRFRAPDRAGEIHATYGVRDARGQRDDAEVVIDVIADDADRNAAPRPDPTLARAVGERPVRIDLDLQTSDPDGDAVTLKGITTAPQLGRVTAIGLDWIEYEPFDTRRGGTDTFEVEVQDKFGASSRAEVRVGVVARASTNQAPVALDDHLLVRPDRTIQFNVLANDADPDGDPLVMSDELQGEPGASVADGFVTVKVPELVGNAASQVAVTYGISDRLGGADTARLTVDASPDAPLYAPVTRDDTADLAKVAGRTPGETVRIDVLRNDGDLDGRRKDLVLTAYDQDVSRVVKGELEVTLAARDQVVVYEVGDAEDNTSYGFVFVSGTDTVPPVLDPDAKLPVTVKAGKSVDISLDEHVIVRTGRTPILTLGDRVSAAPYVDAARARDTTTIRFTAPEDSSGRAAVTFEVTDGTSLNDATGLTSMLTIPVDIQATKNFAPEMRDVDLEVVGGDEAEQKTFDLASTATDPNPEDVAGLTFTVEGTEKVEASITGRTTLVLDATDAAEDGEVVVLPVRVEDPAGATAEAVVRVRIVRSDKPLVSIGRIGPLEAEAGQPVSFDINDYATNPYEGTPLTVSGVTVESGEARATGSGSTVTVTPAERFAGSVGVRFVVDDGSDDAEREVTARAEVVVVAAPDAPGRPTVSSMTHDSVVLTWTPADDKGAPISGYSVRRSEGKTVSCGGATTCRIEGLTPGNTYSFQVVATNRVGDSEPSVASEQVTPDKVPDRMAAPTVGQDYTQRDGKLVLQWQAPANVGSPIRTYEIHRLGTGETRTAAASPFTWDGLGNGALVQFEIRAVNDIVDEASKQSWSEPSTADKPFGVPATVGQPSGVASENDALPGGKVEVTWPAPLDNGDTIDHYEVTMSKDGHVVTTKQETGTSSHFDVDNGHDYTFTVRAHNRAGYSTSPSAVSAPVNPYDRATAVRDVTKVSEGDRTAKVSFAPPTDDGGRRVTGYRISSSGGPAKTVTAAGTHDITFTSNNGPYEVTIVPITTDPRAGAIEGESAGLGGFRPFGAPAAPNGGSAAPNYRQVDFSGWSAPGANGRPVLGTQYRTDGGWVDGGSVQWPTMQGGDQRCISIRTVAEGATPSDRLYSTERQLCGSAQPRQVIVYFSNAPDPTDACTARCDWIHYRLEGFRSNAGYVAAATQNGGPCGGAFPNAPLRTTGGDGRLDFTTKYWYTGCNESVTVTVDGISGVGNPPTT